MSAGKHSAWGSRLLRHTRPPAIILICDRTSTEYPGPQPCSHNPLHYHIRDRLDFSCAVFDTKGPLSAQAAHISVPLGSMAFAMSGIVECLDPAPGDMVILNDPYLGGTHLPEVTLIAPLFHGTEHCGFVVNRAHYADIGCTTPGGMPMATGSRTRGS